MKMHYKLQMDFNCLPIRTHQCIEPYNITPLPGFSLTGVILTKL